VVTRMGLMSFADRRLGTLSGGERQRLVLARALAQQAPVLLLDEPTSALDLGRRVDALELVDELRLERALTVVSAVHDLTLAGQFADLLALMDRGRLVATGSPADVLREDVLGEIYDASVRVIDDDGHLIVTSQRWGSWAREEIR
jgi:iron complex transport system ATP-binding protein